MTLNEAIDHLDDILGPDKKWDCKECKNEHIALREWLKELKGYKDLEEQKKLLKLPCAVGDTVYRFYTVDDVTKIYKHHLTTLTSIVNIIETGEIGKSVFFTQEKAEAALKKIMNI